MLDDVAQATANFLAAPVDVATQNIERQIFEAQDRADWHQAAFWSRVKWRHHRLSLAGALR